MRIVFHGENAANFSTDFAGLAGPGHEIAVLPDQVVAEVDKAAFQAAEVLVAARFDGRPAVPEGLRLLQVPGAGYDGISFETLPAGTIVCNCFGHEQAIAEYVLGALLLRRIPFVDADRQLREGRWAYQAGRLETTHGELAGSTIGILGFGHIGKALASRAKAFDMRVHVANRSRPADSTGIDRIYSLDELSAFWSSADSFVVTVPLAADTQGMVGSSAFEAMGSHTILVNVSRGAVVDEATLYGALASGRIAGAIIDTWYRYPAPDATMVTPSKLPFHELPNVLMTPHMSGWTDGTIRRRKAVIAENVIRLQEGSPLLHVVRG